MIKIFKYTVFDLIRSRWSQAYFLFFLLTSMVLLFMSNDVSRAIGSLLNVVIILCPLIGTLFGIMYYYNSREFTEFLQAQPLKRTSILMGQYLGLSSSLSLSFVLGLCIPFLIFGVWRSDYSWNFYTLLLVGGILTFIFTAFSSLIGLSNENKIKGFGYAIFIWLFLAVIYDGIFLLALFIFDSYPVEKLAIFLTLLNPIDLARILMMLQLDISALMGYTGAVFNKFFGTGLGMSVSFVASLLWIMIPLMIMRRISLKKDF